MSVATPWRQDWCRPRLIIEGTIVAFAGVASYREPKFLETAWKEHGCWTAAKVVASFIWGGNDHDREKLRSVDKDRKLTRQTKLLQARYPWETWHANCISLAD